jgi:hippurate hydrolase
VTANDPAVTDRVTDAFRAFFGARPQEMGQQTASEDFSDIPSALGGPYTDWGLGGIDAGRYREAEAAGRVSEDIPHQSSSA